MWNLALFLLLIAVTAVPLTAQVGGTPTTGSGGQTSIQANPSLGSGGGAKGTDALAAHLYLRQSRDGRWLGSFAKYYHRASLQRDFQNGGIYRFQWTLQFPMGRRQHDRRRRIRRGLWSYSEFQLRRLRQFSIGRRRQCLSGRSIRQPDDELRSTGQRGGLFLRRNQPVQSPDCRQSRCWLDRPPSHCGRRGIVHQRNVDAGPKSREERLRARPTIPVEEQAQRCCEGFRKGCGSLSQLRRCVGEPGEIAAGAAIGGTGARRSE